MSMQRMIESVGDERMDIDSLPRDRGTPAAGPNSKARAGAPQTPAGPGSSVRASGACRAAPWRGGAGAPHHSFARRAGFLDGLASIPMERSRGEPPRDAPTGDGTPDRPLPERSRS